MFKIFNKKRKAFVLILVVSIFAFCITASAQEIRHDSFHSLDGYPSCYNNYGSNIGYGASNITSQYIFYPIGQSSYTSPYQYVYVILYEDGYSQDSTYNSGFNISSIGTSKNWNYGSQGHLYSVLCTHRADIGSVAWAGNTSGGFYWG